MRRRHTGIGPHVLMSGSHHDSISRVPTNLMLMLLLLPGVVGVARLGVAMQLALGDPLVVLGGPLVKLIGGLIWNILWIFKSLKTILM